MGYQKLSKIGVKKCHFDRGIGVMNMNRQTGFSLIELLLVVVIIGVIAAMAIPAYQKGMWAAENGSAFGTMRTIASTQVQFYSGNGRFGRLNEVNSILGKGIGTEVGDSLVRGRYVFTMSPAVPTDNELKIAYTVVAKRDVAGDVLYQYEVDQTGRIWQVWPAGAPVN
jgi:prepilin-type N-terminal cleavage/methylation domain-containing protein